MRKYLVVLAGVFVFLGCTVRQIDSSGNVISIKNYGSSFSSNDTALTEKELRQKIINHEVYTDKESFTVLDNKILFYYEKRMRKRVYGTWYFRKVYNPTRDEYVDSFCIVKGQIRKGLDNSTVSKCMRFYPEDDAHGNLYLGVGVYCTGFGAGNCSINNKYTGYYRFRKTEVED